MNLDPKDREALVSLYESGELEDGAAESLALELTRDPELRSLLESFRRLSDLCGLEMEEEAILPEADARRILEDLHARMDEEGLGVPAVPGDEEDGAQEEAGTGGEDDLEEEELEREFAPRLPEILTVAEVARYLRVTREELEAELDNLPFFEFAGRLRMRRESLLAWVEERESWSRRQRFLSLPGGAVPLGG